MTLILINVIRNMILNNIQEVLTIGRTLCVIMTVLQVSSLVTRKVLNENELYYYSVLKSTWHQLLNSGIKNRIPFKNIDLTLIWPWRCHKVKRMYDQWINLFKPYNFCLKFLKKKSFFSKIFRFWNKNGIWVVWALSIFLNKKTYFLPVDVDKFCKQYNYILKHCIHI